MLVIIAAALIASPIFGSTEEPTEILRVWRNRTVEMKEKANSGLSIKWKHKVRISKEELKNWAALGVARYRDDHSKAKRFAGHGKILLKNGRYRFEVKRSSVINDGNDLESIFVFDGEERTKRVTDDSSVAVITKMDESVNDFNDHNCIALIAFIEPFRVLPKTGWEFIKKNITRNGNIFDVIGSGPFEIWVDSSSGEALPTRLINKNYGVISWDCSIEYSTFEDRKIPTEWRMNTYDSDIVMMSISGEQAEFDFSPFVQDSDFHVELNAGTWVYDNRNGYGVPQKVNSSGAFVPVNLKLPNGPKSKSTLVRNLIVGITIVGTVFLLGFWIKRRSD